MSDETLRNLQARAAIIALPAGQWQHATALIARGVAPADALAQAQAGEPEPAAAAPVGKTWAERFLAGRAGDPAYDLAEGAMHEAAHATVAAALDVPVEYLWLTERGGGAVKLARPAPVVDDYGRVDYPTRVRDAAISVAPMVWLQEYRFREFPVPPRGCQHDQLRVLKLLDAAGVDAARRLARRVLDQPDRQAQVEEMALRLARAPLVTVMTSDGSKTVRLVELGGRATRLADLTDRPSAPPRGDPAPAGSVAPATRTAPRPPGIRSAETDIDWSFLQGVAGRPGHSVAGVADLDRLRPIAANLYAQVEAGQLTRTQAVTQLETARGIRRLGPIGR